MATTGNKRCYYDVLGVERNAIEDDIRKSYKKLALKLHPDKNQNSEESTRSFSELQSAFEVLIDKQERAWYDKHRKAILSTESDYKNYKDNSVDLLPYFTASCYTGLGDGATEFFSVYRNLFEKISQEDKPFREYDDIIPPTFGDSTSDYDTLVYSFYAHWMSYCTPISFVWKEKYDIREAPTRRVARAAELDNVKLREQAKKERNERVRTLTMFVRKRDFRVKAYEKVLSEKRRERELKVKEQSLEQKRILSRMYESSPQNGVSEEIASESSSTESDLDAREENYCPACEKNFHSHKTFLNHQKSTRHKENVSLLRSLLEDQDQIDGLEQLEVTEVDTQKSSSKKSKKKRKKNRCTLIESLPSDQSDSEKEAPLFGEDSDDEFVMTSSGPNQPLASEECVKGWGYFDDKPHLIKKSKKVKKKVQPVQPIVKNKVAVSKTNPLVCRICKQEYATRNQLFLHIVETGHAIAKV